MDFTDLNEIRATVNADAFAGKLDAAKRLASGAEGGAQHDVNEAGLAFEKLFSTLLVKEMTKTLSTGFFGEGPGAETFQGWLEDELGAALAKDGRLGIAEAVRASLLQKQASVDAKEGNA
jgi:Rod binding domain-containing protein